MELKSSGMLIVVEEHVAQGGAGQMLAYALLKMGETPFEFRHHCAMGYLSGRYGSQQFHRKECELNPEAILADFTNYDLKIN